MALCLADGGHPEGSRRMVPHRHGITAKQRYGKAVDRLFQPLDKGRVPLVAGSTAIAEQDTKRLGAFCCQIRQIDRHQFPRDIGGIGVGQKMDALHHHVVSHHQLVPPERHHRDVIGKAARGRVGGDGFQPVNEI